MGAVAKPLEAMGRDELLAEVVQLRSRLAGARELTEEQARTIALASCACGRASCVTVRRTAAGIARALGGEAR